MAISGSLSVASSPTVQPVIDSDPRISSLLAKIHDWETCPTTPADQKKQIVTKLNTELTQVRATLKNDLLKAQEAKAPAPKPLNPPAYGHNVDITI